MKFLARCIFDPEGHILFITFLRMFVVMRLLPRLRMMTTHIAQTTIIVMKLGLLYSRKIETVHGFWVGVPDPEKCSSDAYLFRFEEKSR